MAVNKKVLVRKACAAAVMAACASSAYAIELDLADGWRASLNTTLSVSSSWRAQDPDRALLNATNVAQNKARNAAPVPASTTAYYTAQGYTGGGTDDYNQNYNKGDQYSELYKVLSEFSFTNGGSGGLFRVKGWYDEALNNDNVPWGNQSSGYAVNKPLSDENMSRLNKFDGLELLDAYLYHSFEVGGMPMQVRAGRLAMNWGESVFIKGVNDNARLDISALRKPGTELKEALLPTYATTFNLGLPGGASLEGFYQFKHDPYNIDECGTFYSPVNGSFNTNKNSCAAADIVGGNRFGYGADTYIDGAAAPSGKEDVDGGEFGFSLKFPIESIDTEIGLYAMNTHAKAPVLDVNVGSDLRAFVLPLAQLVNPAFTKGALGAAGIPLTPFKNTGLALIPALTPVLGAGAAAALGGAIQTALADGVLRETQGYWLYPEDIQTYGISAATTIEGWSVAAELSYQHDVPVLMNAVDLLNGVIGGAGPLASGQFGAGASNALPVFATGTSLNNQAPVSGTVEAWKRVDKTQFQVNGLVTVPRNFLGLENTSGLFIAEAGFQWADLPSGYRFGRGFIFGAGEDPGFSTAGANGVTCTKVGTSLKMGKDGCKDEGYATEFSWAYRVRASLDYAGIFGTSWQATPSIFIGHDVEGFSIDGQFSEGRLAVGYGLQFDLNKEHKVNFNYNWFSDSADYDAFRDHDNYSVSYSYTF